MNVKKTIATIGLTGMLGLTLGMTPAMAADNGKAVEKGNSVSQAAQTKAKGESNKEAAQAHAPGQVKKAAPAPAPTPVPEPTPAPTTGGGLQGMEEIPEPGTTVPVDAPVEEAPVVEGAV